ncbi:methionine--tRNA ligase, partial [Aduncisulcus paluster]
MSRLGTVMYVLLENMRKIAVHLWPVMPEASEMMLEQLGIQFAPEKVNLQGEIDSGTAQGRTCSQEKEAKKSKKQSKQAKEEIPGVIEFPDFQKVDMRVGTVLSVTKHPDADKLLLVKIDTGDDEPRQVVAGLAEFFKPEELEG